MLVLWHGWLVMDAVDIMGAGVVDACNGQSATHNVTAVCACKTLSKDAGA